MNYFTQLLFQTVFLCFVYFKNKTRQKNCKKNPFRFLDDPSRGSLPMLREMPSVASWDFLLKPVNMHHIFMRNDFVTVSFSFFNSCLCITKWMRRFCCWFLVDVLPFFVVTFIFLSKKKVCVVYTFYTCKSCIYFPYCVHDVSSFLYNLIRCFPHYFLDLNQFTCSSVCVCECAVPR